MRLFIAILLEESMKKTMLACMDQLREQTTYAKFTRADNLHLTLAFIGESDRVGDITAVIDEVVPSDLSMTLRTAGAGHFGSIWFAGLNSTDAVKGEKGRVQKSRLCHLADAVRQRLWEEGFAVDDKPFRPHVTLAREVESRRSPFITVPNAEMKVQRVSLMRSDRIDGRLTYTEVWGKDVK